MSNSTGRWTHNPIDGGLSWKGPPPMDGISGPVGVSGVRGREIYLLVYSGIPFKVALLPETFAMIVDARKVNGDDLNLIKMVNIDEWEKIRSSWSNEWTNRKAHKAFEFGTGADRD